MDNGQLKSQSRRVCSRHFPGGDPSKEPLPTLGERFASPIRKELPRAKRAKVRETNTAFLTLRTSVILPVCSSTPVNRSFSLDEPLITPTGMRSETNYDVHELRGEHSMYDCPSTLSSQ